MRVFLEEGREEEEEEEDQKKNSETEGELFGVYREGGEPGDGKRRWKGWCEVAKVLVEGRGTDAGGTGISQEGQDWTRFVRIKGMHAALNSLAHEKLFCLCFSGGNNQNDFFDLART